MRDYIEERLEQYIEQEKNRLKKEEEVCGFRKDRFMDLLTLETLNSKEKEEIVDKVVNSEALYNFIEEDINYHLYHR